jgi:hypothetical protein
VSSISPWHRARRPLAGSADHDPYNASKPTCHNRRRDCAPPDDDRALIALFERVAAHEVETDAAVDDLFRDDPDGRQMADAGYARVQAIVTDQAKRVLGLIEESPELPWLDGAYYQLNVLVAALAELVVTAPDARIAAGYLQHVSHALDRSVVERLRASKMH